jgi:hypothetical protein
MDRNLHLLGDCVDFTNLAYSCRHGLSSVDSLALSLCSNQSNSIVCFVRQLFVFLQNCNDSHILDTYNTAFIYINGGKNHGGQPVQPSGLDPIVQILCSTNQAIVSGIQPYTCILFLFFSFISNCFVFLQLFVTRNTFVNECCF